MAKVTGLLLLGINRFVSEQKMREVLLKAELPFLCKIYERLLFLSLKVCVAPVMIFFF